MEHWDAKHYPLAVKLGTITPDGADVYSYDEDEMVEDPELPKHLAHFGINIALMTKVGGRSAAGVWVLWGVSTYCAHANYWSPGGY